MNIEQQNYISLINEFTEDRILIKKTGWEEINLPNHAHDKFQIIYTLSGTLHIQIGTTNHFIPEGYIAWIPSGTVHKLSSNNRQISLIIFYVSINSTDKETSKHTFSIYRTNTIVVENLKFISSKGNNITQEIQPDLYHFTLSFFNLLPQMAPEIDFALQTLIIPNDSRLKPVLDYMARHIQEELRIEQIAERYNLSNRNLSRLFHASGIHFSSYVNHLRIVRAIELLTDGEKTMQEIAYEVGFNTPNNFNRVFKQITGKSPKMYLHLFTNK